MKIIEMAVIGGGSVVGWLLVSWFFDSRKAESAESDAVAPTPSAPRDPDELTLSELGQQWHSILGVSAKAEAMEIEAAYQAAISECDRIRFDAGSSASALQMANSRRKRISSAYEFIRSVRRNQGYE